MSFKIVNRSFQQNDPYIIFECSHCQHEIRLDSPFISLFERPSYYESMLEKQHVCNAVSDKEIEDALESILWQYMDEFMTRKQIVVRLMKDNIRITEDALSIHLGNIQERCESSGWSEIEYNKRGHLRIIVSSTYSSKNF